MATLEIRNQKCTIIIIIVIIFNYYLENIEIISQVLITQTLWIYDGTMYTSLFRLVIRFVEIF